MALGSAEAQIDAVRAGLGIAQVPMWLATLETITLLIDHLKQVEDVIFPNRNEL